VTQSAEVVFALIFELLIVDPRLPSPVQLIGLFVVMSCLAGFIVAERPLAEEQKRANAMSLVKGERV
jgi:Putative multidrug resistance efflux transporter